MRASSGISDDMALVAKCPGLKLLRFSLNATAFVISGNKLRSFEDVMLIGGLNNIFECRKLIKIHIRVYEVYPSVFNGPLEARESLGGENGFSRWLGNQFMIRQRRTVIVTIKMRYKGRECKWKSCV
jgi:hypothetical protein